MTDKANITPEQIVAALAKAPKFWRETSGAQDHMAKVLNAALSVRPSQEDARLHGWLWKDNIDDDWSFSTAEPEVCYIKRPHTISAALAAQEQVPVEVAIKSLEWNVNKEGDPTAKTLIGTYVVILLGKNWHLFFNRSKLPVSRHESADAAMSAAQADYEACIRSALVASTPPAPVSSETVDWSAMLEKYPDIEEDPSFADMDIPSPPKEWK